MVRRVLIVHRHLAYGEAIQASVDAQPELRCIDVATTSRGAIRAVRDEEPDVILIDLELASGAGLISGFSGRLVVMTSDVTLETFEEASRLGATGLVGKDAPVSEVLEALRATGSRMTVSGTTLELLLASAGSGIDLRDRVIDEVDVGLTQREREVLELMRQGVDARTMAEQLHVSVHTTRSHIKRVLAKLGAHSQLEAVAIANRLALDDQRRYRP